MGYIDSDAHVLEIEQTWDYLDPADRKYRPMRVTHEGHDGQEQAYWAIDGQLKAFQQPGKKGKPQGPHGDHVETPDDSKFLLDVGARLRHMDELGTDVQVLYPTLFIQPVTRNPDVEVALCKAYNRWLADIWAQSKNRLRWAAVLPLLSMDKALEQLEFAHQNGACCVFMLGVQAGNRLLYDPYFYPLYQRASELDLAMCVHTGNGSPEIMSIFPPQFGLPRFKLIGVGAFNVVVESGLMDTFPQLRFGFVELSAQWLPYLIHDLTRRIERRGERMKQNILGDNRIWVACQTNDDLPYIMQWVGDDNLVIGTDYGHADTSTEILALQTLNGDDSLPAESRRKILVDNARALYAL